MRRIEVIAAAILAAAGAFFLVPGGQAAPLSKATPAPAIEQAAQARPGPSVRVVYPSPYAVPASSR
ncbi:MAG TPA: hypothetical protein VE420_07050 [Gemmatimonadales bacterium]|nr:hypothetical protein [Gemmatimonadales bacterium]